jgi:hypothetical protein
MIRSGGSQTAECAHAIGEVVCEGAAQQSNMLALKQTRLKEHRPRDCLNHPGRNWRQRGPSSLWYSSPDGCCLFGDENVFGAMWLGRNKSPDSWRCKTYAPPLHGHDE